MAEIMYSFMGFAALAMLYRLTHAVLGIHEELKKMNENKKASE